LLVYPSTDRKKKKKEREALIGYACIYRDRRRNKIKEKKSSSADRQEIVDALSMRRYRPYPM
jgi:hypothetical protein